MIREYFFKKTSKQQCKICLLKLRKLTQLNCAISYLIIDYRYQIQYVSTKTYCHFIRFQKLRYLYEMHLTHFMVAPVVLWPSERVER